MTLTQLNYLCAAHRYGTFSKAAQELFVSQPSLSVAIHQLELELGVLIFERTKSKLRPTEKGLVIIEQAQFVLESVNQLKHRADEMSNEKEQLRIGVSPINSRLILSMLHEPIEKFRRTHKRLEITIHESPPDQVLRGLYDEKTDMIIGTIKAGANIGCHQQQLISANLMLCVSKGCRWATMPAVDLQDLQGVPLLTFMRENSKINETIEEHFRSQGLDVQFQYYSQINVVEELIRMGSGMALLIPGVHIPMENIAFVPLQQPICIRIGLMWKRGHILCPDSYAFIDALKKAFDQDMIPIPYFKGQLP